MTRVADTEKWETRTVSFSKTCATCKLTLAPQMLRVRFEAHEDGWRIRDWHCLHHKIEDIRAADETRVKPPT